MTTTALRIEDVEKVRVGRALELAIGHSIATVVRFASIEFPAHHFLRCRDLSWRPLHQPCTADTERSRRQ